MTQKQSQILHVSSTHHLLLWKVAEYIGLSSFLIILPRFLGPDRYGDFAIIYSALMLLWLVSSLGGQVTFGRYFPEFSRSEKPHQIETLFTYYYILRLLISALLAIVFFAIVRHLLPELNQTLILTATGAFFLGGLSQSCTQLFYGQSHISKWLTKDALSRLILAFFVLMLSSHFGFASVIYGIFAVELLFFIVLHYWAMQYFKLDFAAITLPEFYNFFTFGIKFFISNLVLMVLWRSGELIIGFVSNVPSEVAYYNLANSITMALFFLFGNLFIMLAPSLTSFFIAEEHHKVDQWLSLVLKYLTIIMIFVLLVILVAGEYIIALLLGVDFVPVASNLFVMCMALIPLNILRAGTSLSFIRKQPKKMLIVHAVAALTFFPLAWLGANTIGAMGVAWALFAAAVVTSFFAYRIFSLANIVKLAEFWKIVIFGGGSLLATALMTSLPMYFSIVPIALYILLLFFTQIVTMSEVNLFFTRKPVSKA